MKIKLFALIIIVSNWTMTIIQLPKEASKSSNHSIAEKTVSASNKTQIIHTSHKINLNCNTMKNEVMWKNSTLQPAHHVYPQFA